MQEAPVECVVVDQHLPDWTVPRDAAIVITHMHYRWEEIQALRRIYEQGTTPVLILSDGILEYRNTWEHPDLADGAIFQPLIGHKLASIGRGQARTIESWGNVGKVEVVGLPRLDRLIEKRANATETDNQTTALAKDPSVPPFRLLIASANTPAFDQDQRNRLIRALGQIKTQLGQLDSLNGRELDVQWRLTDGLDQEIGLPKVERGDLDEFGQAERIPLNQVMEQVDAVITTPSTIYLESVLNRKPTALLDCFNSPHYVPSAWTISDPSQLAQVLTELSAPPQPKMLFQESVLNDQLECHTPAMPRMIQLISEMIQAGQDARTKGTPIQLPYRILEDPQKGFSRVGREFELTKLYPNNQIFSDGQTERLRSELTHARKRLQSLPAELVQKNIFIGQLIELRDKLKLKNSNLRSRIMKLRKALGIQPPKNSDADDVAGAD